MNLPSIKPGLTGTAEKTVSAADLATAHRSGTVDVFATPAMIALMEEAAVAALADVLPAELTSVGISLDIRHLAATPPGMPVQATATVTRSRRSRHHLRCHRIRQHRRDRPRLASTRHR